MFHSLPVSVSFKRSQAGFSLIEMIVSLGLFSVVATVAVGSFLVILAANKQLQTEQSVLTNLSFAIDGMSREIRTGTNYYCVAGNQLDVFANANLDTLHGSSTRDCAAGRNTTLTYHGISFVEGGSSITGASASRIAYFFNANDKQLYRKVGDQLPQPLLASGVDIKEANFYVTGTDKVRDGDLDTNQPTVSIYISATENALDENAKVHHLHTTVTQRALDI